MSDETSLAGRLRAGYAAFNETGDPGGILAELDPDVELVVSERGPEGAIVFQGHAGVTEWARGMGDVWRNLTFEPLEIESDATGQRALVVVRVSTRGRSSDVGVEATEAHVLTLGPKGKVSRIQAFHDLEQARAALGPPDPGL